MLVLRNPAVAGLTMAKDVFDDMERMPNLGAHTGLEPFHMLCEIFGYALRELFDLAALTLHKPIYGTTFVFSSLLSTGVPRIREDLSLFAMK